MTGEPVSEAWSVVGLLVIGLLLATLIAFLVVMILMMTTALRIWRLRSPSMPGYRLLLNSQLWFDARNFRPEAAPLARRIKIYGGSCIAIGVFAFALIMIAGASGTVALP